MCCLNRFLARKKHKKVLIPKPRMVTYNNILLTLYILIGKLSIKNVPNLYNFCAANVDKRAKSWYY